MAGVRPELACGLLFADRNSPEKSLCFGIVAVGNAGVAS
jgi:hypothetical protein